MTIDEALDWLDILERGKETSNRHVTITNHKLKNGVWLGWWGDNPIHRHVQRLDVMLLEQLDAGQFGLCVAPGEPYGNTRPVFKSSSCPRLGRLELDFNTENWFFRWDAADDKQVIAMVEWLKLYEISDHNVFLAEIRRAPYEDDEEVLHINNPELSSFDTRLEPSIAAGVNTLKAADVYSL